VQVFIGTIKRERFCVSMLIIPILPSVIWDDKGIINFVVCVQTRERELRLCRCQFLLHISIKN
jgi:hypothetical protein